MADDKAATAKKPKPKDHQVKRKLFKHELGAAKRDETVSKLPKKQRRRTAAAKARKAFRVAEKAREAEAAAKAAKAAKPAEAPPAS